MVLGIGPLPKYIWRIPRLLTLLGTPRPFQWFQSKDVDNSSKVIENKKIEAQAQVTPLDIKEDAGSVSLTSAVPQADLTTAVPQADLKPGTEERVDIPAVAKEEKDGSETVGEQVVTPAVEENKEGKGGNRSDWLKRVPSVSVPSLPLPSYVPFGQVGHLSIGDFILFCSWSTSVAPKFLIR
jgi:hypothetical protein